MAWTPTVPKALKVMLAQAKVQCPAELLLRSIGDIRKFVIVIIIAMIVL